MEHIDERSVPHAISTIEGQRAVWLAGPATVRQEVVGEAYNQEQMGRVLAGLAGRTDAVLSAWLLPEPSNQADPYAVMVWVFGGRVGYLPKELAHRWQPLIVRLATLHAARVACQAMIDPPSHANGGQFGVVLWLPSLPQRQPVAPVPFPPPAAVPVPFPPAPIPSAPFPHPSAAHAHAQAPQVAQQPPRPDPPPLSPEALIQLRGDIENGKVELARLQRELNSVEEALDIQSFGFYQPKYGFESSAQYVTRLKSVRDEQLALIKDNKATNCDTQWKVGGSAAEGKKMIRNQSKLMLRAFNGECDAAVAKVKYDNVATMVERITKSCEAINKLGLVQHVSISHRYFALKLAELHLVHEHRDKIQEEKEEQRLVREQMREEQKAEAEIEKAKAEAEKEEATKSAALEKARAELERTAATEAQHEKLEQLVSRLETELSGAIDRKAKAIARAQLTKSGHVYVLSNIGSFGEGVYKIGMTRRLEPLERVDELGDASVPFPFDVHAIIYCEDAPSLENKLHKAFAHRRVNQVNFRKEYFRVTLDEIRDAVDKNHGLVTFLLVAEAEQYRKTQAALSAVVEASVPG